MSADAQDSALLKTENKFNQELSRPPIPRVSGFQQGICLDDLRLLIKDAIAEAMAEVVAAAKEAAHEARAAAKAATEAAEAAKAILAAVTESEATD